MKIQGDIESVDLSTGQRYRRVSGDGESRLEPQMLQPFIDEMNKVIPQIVAERLRREKLWWQYIMDNPWL